MSSDRTFDLSHSLKDTQTEKSIEEAMRFFDHHCFVVAILLCLLALALADTHESAFSSRQHRDSQSLSVHQPATDRKLGTRTDIATEALGAVVDKVVGDVAEKEGVRRAYYRRARKQLYWEVRSTVEWARIEEEDAELELMKRQKDEKPKEAS